MLKSVYILFIGFVLLFTFNSCSTNSEAEIKKVEELSINVKLLQAAFEEADIEEVNSAIDDYHKNTESMQKYFTEDTIGYEIASTLNHYKGIKKTSGKVDKNYTTIKKNIEQLENQLNKLKIDLENNAVPEDSIQNFIQFETDNIAKLSDNIGTFVTDCKYILETHETYAEKVRSYSVAFK